MVAGTAVMGKTTENLGDSFAGFSRRSYPRRRSTLSTMRTIRTRWPVLCWATPRHASSTMCQRFCNSRTASPNDPSQWQPVFAATLARETHVSDLTGGQSTKIQISSSIPTDSGREIQKKIQAEPGPVVDQGPVVDPRWVASGWTIFNNKGKPVRQYEPFFSQLPRKDINSSSACRLASVRFSVMTRSTRVVATIHPNHTYEKIVFDPWHQDSWDVNDTVLQTDPTADLT